jgi:hypothetical protein
METEQVLQGADFARTITILDRHGDAITTYTGAAALAATLWPGDDQAALLTLSAVWVTPSAGTARIGASASQTATLEPGVYPVRLSITASGVVSSAVVLQLEVLAAPGTALAPPSYCSFADMRSVVPWIGELITTEDQSGFSGHRGAARAWLDSVVLSKVPAGRAAGPRDLVAHGGASSRQWVASLLDDDALVLTGPDGKRLKRACALFACAEVLKYQVGSRDETSYQALAHDLRHEAESLARQGVAWLDADDDGIGDLMLDLSTLRVARG